MWGQEGKRRRCENVRMCKCEDVRMGRCEDEQMWSCEDVKMSRCEVVKMWRCEDVKMRRCEDEKMWRWEDVKMRRCEDEKMMRKCEDEKMWKWEDVKMRRCEDEKMWRWEDVKMWRWEDETKMWRWEYAKMRRWDTDPHYWKNPALRRSREENEESQLKNMLPLKCSPSQQWCWKVSNQHARQVCPSKWPMYDFTDPIGMLWEAPIFKHRPHASLSTLSPSFVPGACASTYPTSLPVTPASSIALANIAFWLSPEGTATPSVLPSFSITPDPAKRHPTKMIQLGTTMKSGPVFRHNTLAKSNCTTLEPGSSYSSPFKIQSGGIHRRQKNTTGTFTARIAVCIVVKAFASSIRAQHPGCAKTDESCWQKECIGAPSKCTSTSMLYLLHRHDEGIQGWRTGRVNGKRCPLEVERVRNPVGQHARICSRVGESSCLPLVCMQCRGWQILAGSLSHDAWNIMFLLVGGWFFRFWVATWFCRLSSKLQHHAALGIHGSGFVGIHPEILRLETIKYIVRDKTASRDVYFAWDFVIRANIESNIPTWGRYFAGEVFLFLQFHPPCCTHSIFRKWNCFTLAHSRTNTNLCNVLGWGSSMSLMDWIPDGSRAASALTAITLSDLAINSKSHVTTLLILQVSLLPLPSSAM